MVVRMSAKTLAVIVGAALVTTTAAIKSSPQEPVQTATVASKAVNPLLNPEGARPGLGAIPRSSLPRARSTIRRVRVGEASSAVRYDRRSFGTPWSDSQDAALGHNGCETRQDVLSRDLVVTARRDGCTVLLGALSDPYTGRTIAFDRSRAQGVQIDHVVALHYAWEHGASSWSDDRRDEYANDPLVLLAVDGPENIRKSDKGPAQYQPPRTLARCALAVRQAQVELRYDLTVTKDDKKAMIEVCS